MSMRKLYIVNLSEQEREYLRELISAGKGPARRLAHARVLLKADQGAEGPAWTDEKITEALEVSPSTIERIRRRFVEGGLELAISRRRPRVPTQRKLDGRQEAQLVALTCGEPPKDRNRWTLRLLADKMVELEYVDKLSYETVRRTLKKTNSSRG